MVYWFRYLWRLSIYAFLLFAVYCCVRVSSIEPQPSAPIEDHIDSLEMEHRLSDLEFRMKRQEHYQERSDDLVVKGFNSTNLILVSLTVFFAFVGVFVSWFIGRAEKKITRIERAVSEKEKTTKALADKVKELSENIDHNMGAVFALVRREDTTALLNRITNVPLDITNLIRLLMTRELEDKDFSTLQKAYSNLCSSGYQDEPSGLGQHTYKDLYLLLFFQQFVVPSLKDNLLREDMIMSFDADIASAFRNDIEKVTREIAFYLNAKQNPNRERILYEYRLALAQSQYKGDNSLLDLLKDHLKDDSLWDSVDERIKSL